jgi:outer membrane lipoprotein SlyB
VLLLDNRAQVTEPAGAQAPSTLAEAAPASTLPVQPVQPVGSAAPALTSATKPAPPAPVVAAEASLPRASKVAPASASSTPSATAPVPVPVCATCGVVSAVTPVEQKGEAGALGTVAGGVVGGVLGHQVGGGSGKTAMTVIGAVGGAVAGREIEKRQRSTTVYETRVRMDDGSTRSFTLETAIAVGQKVRVQGDQLAIDGAAVKQAP